MVQDLCVIMLTAGIISLLFKLIRQPVVLGYIMAGIVIGPYVCGSSWISHEDSVQTWSEIGVLFLLFAMGLEFSFKKLLQVGSTAFISASVILVGMMSCGFVVGRLLGWSDINALFLGGILSMSSTTIVFKALDDMGLSKHQFAKVGFGILVVEDLFAVVLMVLLSSIATTRTFEGGQMLLQVAQLIAYLVLWFVLSILLIPTFLKRFHKHLNDETLTIISVGLCLGMVLLAVAAGFSSALGAFFMGSILAETLEGERIERLTMPLKNIFGAIFFVSVGMIVNPAQLLTYAVPIVCITLLVIVGQIVFATCGTLLSGQSLKVSIQTGCSLVQIGEFAFIIANLGESLGVTDSSLYPIVVAVSVITTFVTPYMVRSSEPLFRFVDGRLSPRARRALQNYAYFRNSAHSPLSNAFLAQSVGRIRWRRWLTWLLVYVVLLLFAWIALRRYLLPLFTLHSSLFSRHSRLLTLLAGILCAVLLFILMRLSRHLFHQNITARERSAEAAAPVSSGFRGSLLDYDLHIADFILPSDSRYAGKSLMAMDLRRKTGVNVVRIIRAGVHINIPGGRTVVYPQDTLVVAGTDEQIARFHELLDSGRSTSSSPSGSSQRRTHVTLERLPISAHSPLLGISIAASGIREQAHCLVVGVEHDGQLLTNPEPSLRFCEGDIVIIAGETKQLRAYIQTAVAASNTPMPEA